MLAVLETGSKQFVVKEGDIINIERLENTDKTIQFQNVLLTSDEKSTQLGKPYLEAAVVVGEVVEDYRAKKEIVFKFKKKTGYQRTYGHRQNLTKVKIVKITTGKPGKKAVSETKATSVPTTKAKSVPETKKKVISETKTETVSNQKSESKKSDS